jgi:2-polyprenyl-3-methyl-5-hydroxy-6-metoxy-1,4-benzoquinol methylase
MRGVVYQWYENKKNIDEMIHWNKGNLKKWERSVIVCSPKKAKILDIGCGMGREAFALSDMGFSVVGIDISEEVIKQVVQLALNGRYD